VRPFAGLLGLCFLARALVFVRPIVNLDGLTIPDDCYYTLTLARSIAHGLGPFTGLAHTNGFQPLFGFLMVPSFWLFRDPLGPVRVAIVVSALADTAALALFGRLLLGQVRDPRVAWLAMFMWAVSPYAISNATNGLETSLAVCLILAAASYFPRLARAESGAREFFVFGVLGGLAVFARVDAGLLLAVAALLSVRRVFGRGTVPALRCGAATAAGVLLVNIPWWLFSYHYMGRVYPDSGRAVRQLSHFAVPDPRPASMILAELAEGVRAILGRQWPTLLFLILSVIVIASRGGTAALRAWLRALWRDQQLLVVFAGALFTAYTTYIFGQWFFARYFYVISVVVLLATTLALDHALALLRSSHRRAALGVCAALFLGAVAARRESRDMYFSADPVHRAWMNVGLWAENHFPAGTVIGGPSSGALGYFAADLTVVNLDGVVNRDAYEAMMTHRLLDYARSVKVEHLLVWDGTLDFIRAETASFRAEDLVFERDLEFESLGMPWHVYTLVPR
jgi:hypothetical protein